MYNNWYYDDDYCDDEKRLYDDDRKYYDDDCYSDDWGCYIDEFWWYSDDCGWYDDDEDDGGFRDGDCCFSDCDDYYYLDDDKNYELY